MSCQEALVVYVPRGQEGLEIPRKRGESGIPVPLSGKQVSWTVCATIYARENKSLSPSRGSDLTRGGLEGHWPPGHKSRSATERVLVSEEKGIPGAAKKMCEAVPNTFSTKGRTNGNFISESLNDLPDPEPDFFSQPRVQ